MRPPHVEDEWEGENLETRKPFGPPPTTRWVSSTHPLPQWVRDIESQPDQWVTVYRGFHIKAGTPVYVDRLLNPTAVIENSSFDAVDFVGRRDVATSFAKAVEAGQQGVVVRYRFPKVLVGHAMNYDNIGGEEMRRRGITSVLPFVEAYASTSGLESRLRWHPYDGHSSEIGIRIPRATNVTHVQRPEP